VNGTVDPTFTDRLILLTGATGYVGGRLLRVFEEQRARVRCLARRPQFLRTRAGERTEVVKGDVLDRISLDRALAGVDTAYYLVHAMGSRGSFEEEDRRGALNFGRAAAGAGCRRIVYLGGLGDDRSGGEALSPHLRSRHEVGSLLRESGVSVIELRASIVLGSGSLSFELIRALVERLPVMVTPRWVSVPAQPIAIDDLLEYLVAAAGIAVEGSPIVEVGGADVVSYGDLMREYARQRGLRRLMVPVPVLTPRLSSLWLGLVTPVFARIGRKLIDSIRHPTVVRDPAAAELFRIHPVGVREAMARAIRNEDRAFAETRWYDAVSAAGSDRPGPPRRFGNRILDSRTAGVNADPAAAFTPVRRIGGRTGWYFGTWLWRLRGFLDLLAGGVGMRRGRRDPDALRVGDVVDWWRVEAYEPDRFLRLAAEMRLPGRAWLEFEVTPGPAGSSLRQTAIFDPLGLTGRLYWLLLYPAHRLIFAGMLRRIVREAERIHRTDPPRASTR
jgi:uncharacterized protein YbjT (DUF2867 family)